MDENDAAITLTDLTEELLGIVDRVRADISRANSITQVIGGLADLYPDALPEHNRWEMAVEGIGTLVGEMQAFEGRQKLRGQAAVLHIMREIPENEDWAVAEMVGALAGRGWLPDSDAPDASVRMALERLVRADLVFKHRADGGPVMYRLRDPGGA